MVTDRLRTWTGIVALASAVAALAIAPAAASAEVAFSAARHRPLTIVPTAIAAESTPAGAEKATIALAAGGQGAEEMAAAILLLHTDARGEVVASESALLPEGSAPRQVVLADLDGDVASEAVVVSGGTDVVSVVRRDGSVLDVLDIALGVPLHGVATGDVDRDGRPDLVVSAVDGIQLLRGDGTGGFARPAAVAAATGARPVLADLNRDGILDLASGRFRMLGDGAGGFDPPVVLFTPLADTAAGAHGTVDGDIAAAADLTGDGVADLAVERECTVFVLGLNCGRGPRALAGDGAGGFAPPVAVDVQGWAFRGIADMDRDGRADVVLAADERFGDAPAVRVVRHGGAGFLPIASAPLTGNPSDYRGLVAPVDLDGDGAVDLVDARPTTIAFLRSLPIVRAPALDFGSRELGAGAIMPLVVRNDGAAPLAMHSVGLTGAAGSDFAIVDDACSARLVAPGGACSVGVGFTPWAVGSRTAELILADDAGDSPQRVALAGAGLAPLPAARAACAAAPAPRPLVRCSLSLGALPDGLRVALRLVRARRVHAAADAGGPRLLSLRRLRPLASGRYTLVTVVAIGARSRQTRQALVIPRPS